MSGQHPASAVARACAADSRINALDQVVVAMAAAARLSGGPACTDCVWTQLVKPLARPLLGWKRGYPLAPAKDPGDPHGGDFGPARRRPPITDTERWLRSDEAWSQVTRTWVARLRAADPATGHGISYLVGGG